MAKEKPRIEVGDTVYHKNAEDKVTGTVTAIRLVEVDWGPECGTIVHREDTLTDKYVQKFGDE